MYLSEQEAFKVKQGQQVTLGSVVLAQPKTARINMISDKADAAGKFLAEVILPNTDKNELKAGILADVHFPMASTKTGLSIPVSALIPNAKEPKVFVVSNNKVTERIIKTGIITSNKVEVVDGLQAGEQVVVSGQLNLENGSAISINQ